MLESSYLLRQLKLCIVLLSFINSIVAQNSFHFTYTINDGLPSNQIYRLLEDKDGFIWVATENGLCKYNGYEFDCYDVSDGLPTNDVYGIVEDSKGRIWLSNVENTISFIKNDSIVNLVPGGRSQKHIIWEDDEMIVFNDGYKNYFIDSENNLLIDTLAFRSQFTLNLANDFKLQFEALETTSFHKNKVIRSFNRKELKDFYTNFNQSMNGLIGSSFDTKSKILLIDLLRNNQFTLNVNPKSTKIISPIIQYHFKTQEFQIYSANRLYLVGNNLNKADTIVLPKFTDAYINSAIKDSQGNIWIATNNGLKLIPQWVTAYNLNVVPGTREYDINHVLKHNGFLFFPDNKGRIYKTDEENLEIFADYQEFSPRPYIYQMDTYGDKLLFSFRTEGFQIMSTRNRSKLPLHQLCDIRDSNELLTCKEFIEVNDYFFYLNGRGLFGGYFKDKRICKINIDKFTHIDRTEDNSGIWISTSNTIFYSTPDELKEGIFYPVKNIKQIESISHLQKDLVLVTTSQLKNYTCSKGKCKDFDLLDGEKVTSTYLYKDEIWVNSTKALYLFSQNKVTDTLEVSYKMPYKVADNISKVNSIYIDSLRIFLATNAGLLNIDKNPKGLTATPLPIFLEVNDNKFSKDTTINFSANDNSIFFKITGLSYDAMKSLTYDFNLDGQSQYSQSGPERTVRLTNLDPGDYTMKIKAQNFFDQEGVPIYFSFTIAAPFWRSWWFYSIIAFLIIGASYSITKYFVGRTKRHAKLQQKFAELELNALQSQMNPHFVFNAMNSLQYIVNSGRTKEADHYISKFSTLLRAYLDASTTKFVTLHQEINIVENYVEIEQLRFQNKIDFEIINNLEAEDYKIKIPASLIQPSVENALVHGFFDKDDGGLLQIMLDKEGDYIAIKIVDNGIGILESKKNKSRRSEHNSRATSILQSKIELLEKVMKYSITHDIQDRSLISNKSGTIVKITIKLPNE